MQALGLFDYTDTSFTFIDPSELNTRTYSCSIRESVNWSRSYNSRTLYLERHCNATTKIEELFNETSLKDFHGYDKWFDLSVDRQQVYQVRCEIGGLISHLKMDIFFCLRK